jgi:acetyl esterase/lipase
MPTTLQYGDSDSQVADLYLPTAHGPTPVVCLLHGGFWRLPYGREEMAPLAADLVARGYAVWNIEYRRVGENGGGWPGALDDVAAAIDHLARLPAGTAALDLARVVVVGHSAGGHLALCVGARSTAAVVVPAAVCGLAAVCDLESAFDLDAGGGAVRALLGGSPQDHPERYAQASPRRLLPLGVRQLLIHGTEDDALPVAMSRAYATAARAAGDSVDVVEIADMGHMEFLDPASEAHALLCRWLRALGA